MALLLGVFFALPPAPVVPMPIDKPARELVANFNAGQFEAASKDFSPAMRAVTTPAVLTGVKKQLDADAGAFKEITELRHSKPDGFRSVDLICAHEKGPVEFRVIFDSSDHVGAISVKRIVPDTVSPTLETAARELLANFNAGRFDAVSKGFNDNMRTQLTLPKLAELSDGVKARYGDFLAVTKVLQRQQQTYRVVDIICAYEKSPARFSVVFDGSGKIAGVQIEPAAP